MKEIACDWKAGEQRTPPGDRYKEGDIRFRRTISECKRRGNVCELKCAGR